MKKRHLFESLYILFRNAVLVEVFVADLVALATAVDVDGAVLDSKQF